MKIHATAIPARMEYASDTPRMGMYAVRGKLLIEKLMIRQQ